MSQQWDSWVMWLSPEDLTEGGAGSLKLLPWKSIKQIFTIYWLNDYDWLLVLFSCHSELTCPCCLQAPRRKDQAKQWRQGNEWKSWGVVTLWANRGHLWLLVLQTLTFVHLPRGPETRYRYRTNTLTAPLSFWNSALSCSLHLSMKSFHLSHSHQTFSPGRLSVMLQSDAQRN